jgi:SAM-dependent methyltransferase
MRQLIKKSINEIKNLVFIINGKKPWSFGYDIYKWRLIKKYLDQKLFSDGKLTENYGYRIDERIIEYPWLFSRLPEDHGILLDAGSTLNFEIILKQPSLKSKKVFISTLAPESDCFWTQGVSYVFEDLRNCCYRNNFFDYVVCISTAEHIGLDNTLLYTNDTSKKEGNPTTYLNAIQEFYRIIKPGGILYLTLPFGKKQNREWFQVFDSQMIDEVIATFNPSSHVETYFRYLPKGWEKSSRNISKDATCFDIHHQTEYDADFAAFSRGIVCLEMKK